MPPADVVWRIDGGDPLDRKWKVEDLSAQPPPANQPPAPIRIHPRKILRLKLKQPSSQGGVRNVSL